MEKKELPFLVMSKMASKNENLFQEQVTSKSERSLLKKTSKSEQQE